MSTTVGGLILPDSGDLVSSSSVKDNFDKVLRNQAGITAPVSPVTGQNWFDTSVPPGVFKVWDGSTWTTIAGGGGGSTGATGVSGYSGVAGSAGATGTSGYSGTGGSGYSGVSGYSGSSPSLPLAITDGGTGQITAPLARGALGAAASGTNTDITSLAQSTTVSTTGTANTDTLGYRGLPINAQSGAYTFAQSDAGKHIYSTNSGAQTITVPTDAAVTISIGSAITIVNNGTTAITFDTTGTTVYKAGTSAAWASGGTLAARGLCTWLKVASNTWFVNGAGLS